MTAPETMLERLLRASGFSQRELGRRARVSNASLIAYAKGRQDPGLTMLQRLADAANCDLVVEVRPRLTPPELRTLELHRLIAEKLEEDPERVLAIANQNLELMRRTDHGRHSRPYLDAWQVLLCGPKRDLARVMVSTDAVARDLRQASPFSGVLSEKERISALLRTDGERVAAKSGRSLDEIRTKLLDTVAGAEHDSRL
ncbi:MAG: helix-turn-helix domain-containing protein [Nitrososphaerales archaeon]